MQPLKPNAEMLTQSPSSNTGVRKLHTRSPMSNVYIIEGSDELGIIGGDSGSIMFLGSSFVLQSYHDFISWPSLICIYWSFLLNWSSQLLVELTLDFWTVIVLDIHLTPEAVFSTLFQSLLFSPLFHSPYSNQPKQQSDGETTPNNQPPNTTK